MTQKLTARKTVGVAFFSYCATLPLTTGYLQGGLSGTGLVATFLFVGLFALGMLDIGAERNVYPHRGLLGASFLISLVWLMGSSFSIDNTLDALTAGPGQVVKSILYVLGATWLLYKLGQLFFCFLTRQKREKPRTRSKLGRLYERHPFGVSFAAVALFWLPHLAIAYPGYMCYDAWNQLAQYFGVIDFTSHHPPVHTVLVGIFVQLGTKLGSGNLGLFLFVLAQALIEAGVFAYTLRLMKDWKTPLWLRAGSFVVIVASPYYIGYVGLVLKDNLYAAMVTLFVAQIVRLLKEDKAFFAQANARPLLALSICGTILFRNNGKLVLYPALLALLVYFWAMWWKKGAKKDFGKLVVWVVLPIVLSTALTAAVTVCYHVESGSIAEALSLPFQQTARYVSEYPEEVTQEEAQAIGAVLDYEHLAEKYNPMISDPVKGTYNKEASQDDLLRYLSTWFKMFWKHPVTYVNATVNQNYYLLYPFTENAVLYSDTFSSGWFVERTNNLLSISEPEGLVGWKAAASVLYDTLFSLPLLGLLSQQALYCLLLIALLIFAVYQKRWKWCLSSIVLILSSVGIIFAPVIQGHPRYAFPIIYSMPLLLAYYIHLDEPAEKKKRSSKNNE